MSSQLNLDAFNMEMTNESLSGIVYLKSFLNSLNEKKDTRSSMLFARAFLLTGQ